MDVDIAVPGGYTAATGAAQLGARGACIDRTPLAWSRSTCVGVGVATLGVGATGIVDLGVLAEDAWRRRRIGTRPATWLPDGGREKGVTPVHADVLVDDVFILRALRRIGPLGVSIEVGGISVDLDLCSQPGQPSGNRLPFGLRTTTGGGRRHGQQAGELYLRRGVRR
jgi:hypothetical protein